MPELPEVEAVRVGLGQLIQGKTVQKVAVFWPRIIEYPEIEQFTQQLEGEKIESIQRRGKFLIFKFTHFDMISHLRMEGKYVFHQQEIPLTKHTHVRFYFQDGSILDYQDVRKFGRMLLVHRGEASTYPGIQKLGPEPTIESFHLDTFKTQLKKYKKAIKPLLLDQTLVTGLGNIYVDEVLYQSGIHPEQPANTLTEKEMILLHQKIIEVLANAIAAGGTTIRTYKNALGEEGNFQIQLKVYDKAGTPCSLCGTTIEKIKVGQRGTHFCPECQKYHQELTK